MSQQVEIAGRGLRARVNRDGQLSVFLGNVEPTQGVCNEIKYQEIATGATETIWSPATGNKIHLVALIVSMDGAGETEIFFGTRLVSHLEFNEKKTAPLPINYPVCVGENTDLIATATGANAYISALGFECTC